MIAWFWLVVCLIKIKEFKNIVNQLNAQIARNEKQLERLRAKSGISNKEIEQLKALGFTTDQAAEALKSGSFKLDDGGLKKPLKKL